MNESARICVAGSRGMVGSAIVRKLEAGGHEQILELHRGRADLTNAAAVERYFSENRPEYVFLAAARVGGVLANDRFSGEFIRDNLLIQTLVIDAAHRHGAKKLLFLGSSCIYPRCAVQPMTETCLLTGALEPTNEAYAVAKIAGITMLQSYTKQFGFNGISLMPTNLYGPGDNFDLETSHVLPAMIRKFHEAHLAGAPEVVLWGTGTPKREFLHVDDLADASVFLMQNYDAPDIINVGTGEDLSIADLAALISEAVGYTGRIVYDSSKPDGTPRKWLDTTRLTELGWRPRVGLREGILDTLARYREHADS